MLRAPAQLHSVVGPTSRTLAQCHSPGARAGRRGEQKSRRVGRAGQDHHGTYSDQAPPSITMLVGRSEGSRVLLICVLAACSPAPPKQQGGREAAQGFRAPDKPPCRTRRHRRMRTGPVPPPPIAELPGPSQGSPERAWRGRCARHRRPGSHVRRQEFCTFTQRLQDF